MNKIFEVALQLSSKEAAVSYLEEQWELKQAKLDAAEAHISELEGAIVAHKFQYPGRGDEEDHRLWDSIAKTRAQSLAKVQADTITKLILEYSHSPMVDGIATRIIEAEDALKFIDELLRGGK